MKYIVVNHCSGHVLAMNKGNGALRCRCYWTRERDQVKRFDSVKYAANIAKMAGGFVMSTREAALVGFIGKAAR